MIALHYIVTKIPFQEYKLQDRKKNGESKKKKKRIK